MEEYLEKTLFELFDRFEFYEDIVNELRTLNSLGELTDEEYNEIMKNYDSSLEKYLNLHKITDERKLEILNKALTFLSELLVKNNVGYSEEIELYKRYLGLNDDELLELGLRDLDLEEELKKENEE